MLLTLHLGHFLIMTLLGESVEGVAGAEGVGVVVLEAGAEVRVAWTTTGLDTMPGGAPGTEATTSLRFGQ